MEKRVIVGVSSILVGVASMLWGAYTFGKCNGYEEGYDIGYETGELQGKTKALNDIFAMKERINKNLREQMAAMRTN